jgi:VIT1/CCC1 family predicted Fe2+/Mn2+ transporter
LAFFLLLKYLSAVDRLGEAAFAVLMVIIINGYVALSDLNTGFLYIVVVNLGACLSWGAIDGLMYAISSSMERNNTRKLLKALKNYVGRENTTELVKKKLNDTFIADFSEEGKTAIAKDIIKHVQDASLSENKLLTRSEILGGLSIVGIYLTVGFLLALPFLVLSDKLAAWVVSNSVGVIWVFWYGVKLGISAGKNRWLLGSIMAVIAILFLVASYITWAA